jgi:ankyrin repeat protein
MGALLSKHTDAVRLLIESGANVNLADDDNITALDDAVRLSQSEVVDMLIKAGGKCGDNFSYSKDCKARKE